MSIFSSSLKYEKVGILYINEERSRKILGNIASLSQISWKIAYIYINSIKNFIYFSKVK